MQAAAQHEMALQQGAGGAEEIQSFLSRHGRQGADFPPGRTSLIPGLLIGASALGAQISGDLAAGP
jgi:hypothetical protein